MTSGKRCAFGERSRASVLTPTGWLKLKQPAKSGKPNDANRVSERHDRTGRDSPMPMAPAETVTNRDLNVHASRRYARIASLSPLSVKAHRYGGSARLQASEEIALRHAGSESRSVVVHDAYLQATELYVRPTAADFVVLRASSRRGVLPCVRLPR